MSDFFEKHPDGPKDLSWSHYKCLITIKSEGLRNILEQGTTQENPTAAQLAQKIKNLSQTQSNKNYKIKRPTDPDYLYKAKVLNIVGGDTLILDVDLGLDTHKEQRIGLAQIDCPKMKTSAGKEAFHFLRDKMVDVDFVAVKTNKIDIFGRYVGDIFYDLTGKLSLDDVFLKGTYLNEEIVENGIARIV
ncbi:MAG: micrococcal nuclease [Myxococcota bacterium]|jgi:micrococcal nuclease